MNRAITDPNFKSKEQKRPNKKRVPSCSGKGCASDPNLKKQFKRRTPKTRTRTFLKKFQIEKSMSQVPTMKPRQKNRASTKQTKKEEY